MKRKYTTGFYVGSFSKRNSSEEKNIQSNKNKEPVENKSSREIISSHNKTEKKNDLLPSTTPTKQAHSNIILPEKNNSTLITGKKKMEIISSGKIIIQKVKLKSQKIKSFDLQDELLDHDFWFWFVIFVIPPVLIMTLIKEGPVAVTLYTIGWAAGIFCLFFFIHLFWLSILLVPVWGVASLILGVMIYTLFE